MSLQTSRCLYGHPLPPPPPRLRAVTLQSYRLRFSEHGLAPFLATTRVLTAAVEDTAGSQRTVTKRITGRTPKLLKWDAAPAEAEAALTSRADSASAPARKRARTSETRRHAASAPAAALAAAQDAAGSDSETAAAIVPHGRRSKSSQHGRAAAGTAVPTVTEAPPAHAAETPAPLITRKRDALLTQRFRSVSAIYKATDAGRSDRAEPAPATEPRRTTAARYGRNAQRAVIAVHGDHPLIASPPAGPPSAQLPGRRAKLAVIARGTPGAAPSTRLLTSETVPSDEPLSVLPATEDAAPVATRARDCTGAAPAIPSDADGGLGAKARKRRVGPDSLHQAVIPVVADDSGRTATRARHRRQAAEDAQPAVVEQQLGHSEDEMDVAAHGDGQADGGGRHGTSSSEFNEASADPDGDVDEDDSDGAFSADDSDVFVDALASSMLAAASAEEDSGDDSADGSEQEEQQPGLLKQDTASGLATEQINLGSEDELGELLHIPDRAAERTCISDVADSPHRACTRRISMTLRPDSAWLAMCCRRLPKLTLSCLFASPQMRRHSGGSRRQGCRRLWIWTARRRGQRGSLAESMDWQNRCVSNAWQGSIRMGQG